MSRELLISWPDPTTKMKVERIMFFDGEPVVQPKGWDDEKWAKYVYSMLSLNPDGSAITHDDDWDGDPDDDVF